VCFAKHTFHKHNLGRLGLKPRSGPLITFTLFSCNNYTETKRRRLYLVKPKAKITVQAPTGECSPPPLFNLSSLCSCFFFWFFLVMASSRVFCVCPPLGFFFIFSLSPFFAYTEVCIYSARVPSRVRSKVSIKLIFFFKFEFD